MMVFCLFWCFFFGFFFQNTTSAAQPPVSGCHLPTTGQQNAGQCLLYPLNESHFHNFELP